MTVPDAELPQSFCREKAKGRTLPSLLFSREEWEEAGQPWSGELAPAVPGKDERSTKDCFSHPFWLLVSAPHHEFSLRRGRSGAPGPCLGRILALRDSSPEGLAGSSCTRNANPGDLCDVPHPSPAPVTLPNFCQALLERGTSSSQLGGIRGRVTSVPLPCLAPQPLGHGKMRTQMQAWVWEGRKGRGREAQPRHGWGCLPKPCSGRCWGLFWLCGLIMNLSRASVHQLEGGRKEGLSISPAFPASVAGFG